MRHPAVAFDLQAALSRMSPVLSSMSQDMDNVLQIVADLSAQPGTALTPSRIQQLQSLDRICQSLTDLTLIAEALATSPEDAANVCGQLQLAETRAIVTPTEPHDRALGRGTVDLF